MTPPVDIVLVIGSASATGVPTSLKRMFRQASLDIHRSDEATALQTLQEWIDNEVPPVAVLITEHVNAPIAVARRVHNLAPMVQIVFLARTEHASRLQQQLSGAPSRIGSNFSIVDPTHADLPRMLSDASVATRQRFNLSTTLDRINLKLHERNPTSDGFLYGNPVVTDRYLASVLEHAGDAILALDRHGRIMTWNHGAMKLFGYEEVAAVERSVDLLVPDDMTSELLALVRETQTEHTATRQELVCKRADGSRFDAAVTAAPLRNEEGRIESVVIIARDITQRKRAESSLVAANAHLKDALESLEAKKRELLELNAQLNVRATTDDLTGLKNRVVFHNSLSEMIAISERSGGPLSLLLIDVDHFKQVNDRWGHLEGDRVLKMIAGGLSQYTRDQDVVARFGGEEFAVLLPNTSLDDAVGVAEKLRVGCRSFVTFEDEVTISVGATAFVPGDNDVTLIDRADRALYTAKGAGRDRVAASEDSNDSSMVPSGDG